MFVILYCTQQVTSNKYLPEASTANMLVLRTANFQGQLRGHEHSFVFIGRAPVQKSY